MFDAALRTDDHLGSSCAARSVSGSQFQILIGSKDPVRAVNDAKSKDNARKHDSCVGLLRLRLCDRARRFEASVAASSLEWSKSASAD